MPCGEFMLENFQFLGSHTAPMHQCGVKFSMDGHTVKE